MLIDCTKPLSANLLNTDSVVPVHNGLLACSPGLSVSSIAMTSADSDATSKSMPPLVKRLFIACHLAPRVPL